mgnify:CR=1 FL=1
MMTRGAKATLLVTAAMAASLAQARPDRAPPPPFDVPVDGRVTATIDGRPVTLFSSPGMPSQPYLSAALAGQLFGPEAAAPRRKGFSIISIALPTDAKVGPVRIAGQAEPAELAVGAVRAKVRTQWFVRDAYDFGEALAGPYGLPHPVLRYTLAPPASGEVAASVPLAGRRQWWIASTTLEFGGKNVLFAFAPHFPTTVMSAAAGRVISAALGGRMTGEAGRQLISHGVERPVRPVAFDRPLKIGSVEVTRALVRTADYGSAGSIPDDTEIDPSESGGEDIIVTGKRKASAPVYLVYVGADALRGCSSLTYDKPRKTISMSCLPTSAVQASNLPKTTRPAA